jgi:chromosome segregation ATPase
MLVGLWAIGLFLFGGVKDDIKTIRSNLQDAQKDSVTRTDDLNKNLGDQIRDLNETYGDLKIEFVKLGGQFELTNKSVDSLTSGFVATNKSIEYLSARLGTTSRSVESLAIGLSATNKSMDELGSRLDKFQAALVSASTQDFDPRRFAPLIDALKKLGIDEQRIIIVPLAPTLPQVS